MNRRLFMSVSSLFIALPMAGAAEERTCNTGLTGLEGMDIESGWAQGFSHFHQLIIPVSYLISPPKEVNLLLTSQMDQGSFDKVGLEQFAILNNYSLDALLKHNHEVYVTREQLLRIASGEENVELQVFKRDDKTAHVHSFFVTAPRSAIATVKQVLGTRAAVCNGPIK